MQTILFSRNMSSFSLQPAILKENKLTDPNFIEWKRNVDIVLRSEGYRYVITESYLGLGENPTLEEIQVDLNWKKVDTMT